MADDREVRESDPLQQQSQERPEQAQQTPLVAEPGTTEEELPDVPPPPYPGPPDGAEGVAAPSYPPQQVPPYMYPPGQGPDDSAVMHPMPYPPKVCYQYPPPGYHYQYPPPGQGLGTAGYPGYQAPPSYPPQQPSLGNALVVTTQPLGGNDVTSSYPAEPKPDSHLMLSILTCLCCSPIFGFFAICLSLSSESSYAMGDIDGARRKGRTAFTLCICGIVLTIVIIGMRFALFPMSHRHPN